MYPLHGCQRGRMSAVIFSIANAMEVEMSLKALKDEDMISALHSGAALSQQGPILCGAKRGESSYITFCTNDKNVRNKIELCRRKARKWQKRWQPTNLLGALHTPSASAVVHTPLCIKLAGEVCWARCQAGGYSATSLGTGRCSLSWSNICYFDISIIYIVRVCYRSYCYMLATHTDGYVD